MAFGGDVKAVESQVAEDRMSAEMSLRFVFSGLGSGRVTERISLSVKL